MDNLLKKIAKDPLAVKRLNFNNYYKEIPKEVAKCINLEVLDVSYSDIRHIPDFVSELPKLKSLRIMGCQELKFPTNLTSFPSLTELSVTVNKPKHLAAVCELEKLASLTLSGEIVAVPETIKNLRHLKQLNLFALPMVQLPVALQKLPKLQILELSVTERKFDLENAITILEKCPVLSELKINIPYLKVPSSIRRLSGLKKLDLSSNGLTGIPSELFLLEKLVELDLGINHLKSLPKGIAGLKKLKVLKLNSNWTHKLDVTNLMDEIHLLENLQTLHLWSCQSVKSIPASIEKCKKLTELDLDNNLLTDLPEAVLKMKWLKKLRLTTNSIPIPEQNKIVAALPTTKVSVDGEWYKR